MTTFVLACTFLLVGDVDDSIPLDQFIRLMREAHSPINDYELICEGQISAKGSAGYEPYQGFQSLYAYRSDGSAYWDIFRKPAAAGEPLKRVTKSVLAKEGRVQERVIMPDVTGGKGSIVSKAGSASTIAYDGSPGRFILPYFWKEFIDKPEKYSYAFEEWEDISGHRCGRVALTQQPTARPNALIYRFWIDFARGCHALKLELTVKGCVWTRVASIDLRRFKLPSGSEVWFPIRAEADTFPDGYPAYPKAPQYHETYNVVQGTLLFNQNLPDSRFRVDWRPSKIQDEGYAANLREVEKLPTASPPVRNNPSQIEQDLELRLNEADRQSKQLAATPPSHSVWNSTSIVQGAMLSAAFVGLGLAFLIWKKRG